MRFDPVPVTQLAQALIRCPSVTPRDAGALDVVQGALEPMGFVCERHKFNQTDNLYAYLGTGSPCLAFAGHTDVVPPGDEAQWSQDPFAATISDAGVLIGRGAVDMKGGVAAFIAAVSEFIRTRGAAKSGRIVVLMTGDEEGSGDDGMKKLLPILVEAGMKLDHCLVGEPTSQKRLGDTIKNGRRGSLNGVVRAIGRQGHVAYPQDAANPLPVLVAFMNAIKGPCDEGMTGFEPSRLEITALEGVNPITNLIPAQALARFNIRFNPSQTAQSLQQWLESMAAKHSVDGVALQVETRLSGEAFVTPPDQFIEHLRKAIIDETGQETALGTGGGTSDARYIKDYCPVVELGLKNATAHQTDEQVPVADLEMLTGIYRRFLHNYFAAPPIEG